jgi:signal transduction histidine kinase
MNLFAITNLLCGTFCLLLAIFALIAGKNKIYRLLAWFNFAVSIWGFGAFAASISTNELMALKSWRIAHSAGYFIAAFFYQLICALTGVKHKKTQFVGYAQALFFIALTLATPWVLFETRPYFGFIYAKATPLYALAVFFYLLFVSLSFVELVRYLRTAQGYQKVQAQYLFYGFFIGFTGGTSLLLPEFYLDWVYPAGNAGVFIYAAIITYAVLKNKILDVEHLAQVAHRDKLAAISTLAASINHEIRNPLYIIQGLADSHLVNVEEGIYSKEQAFEKANDILKKTREQATRAMLIMKQFATFAKQNVKNETCNESVCLNGTLERVIPLVQHEFQLQKIQIDSHIPKNISPIKADQHHIDEILLNLILNSAQAMKDGGKISLKAERQNGHVNVLIEDNGPGIPKDQITRIFEPFYTTKQEGTGLGLYITKQLVERNGGKISVKSKVGEGTQFLLEFKR